jgi:hypothetical protein
MPLWAKIKTMANEGYFCPTSAVPHLTPSSPPSFASLQRDLRDDTTCAIRRRYLANFETKLGNPSPTYFVTKQAIRY